MGRRGTVHMVYDGWRYQPIGLGAAAFRSGL